jgi:predicted hotdog family 3-hydroxylacyl-ACP dehydratase
MGTLPHRPPFVWIDEIVEVAADHGVCAVELKSDGLYFGPEGLRASSFLEFMAQGFGYLRAAQSVTGLFPDRPPPTKAFLVSIQDAVYATDPAVLRPASGTRLRIEISGVREVGPITLFAAVVRDASGTELVRARLKVFSE